MRLHQAADLRSIQLQPAKQRAQPGEALPRSCCIHSDQFAAQPPFGKGQTVDIAAVRYQQDAALLQTEYAPVPPFQPQAAGQAEQQFEMQPIQHRYGCRIG